MFTVKLAKNGRVMKILAGEQVDIEPGHIAVTVSAGVIKRFSVGSGADAYSAAYIENSEGKTTEIVRA